MTEKRHIVIFDFDGTLTRHDSFIAFIRFSVGMPKLIAGLIACAPALIGFKLGWISNSRAKQRLFSHFFRHFSTEDMARFGRGFIPRLDSMVRQDTYRLLQRHLSGGATVYVVSASMDLWIEPWCRANGVHHVITTQAETADGRLTGRFSTPNCYGEEKVTRLLACEPDRTSYHLTAYGDSHGDDAMLRFADTAFRVTRRGIRPVINIPAGECQ